MVGTSAEIFPDSPPGTELEEASEEASEESVWIRQSKPGAGS